MYMYPARGRVGRVTDCWVRGHGFKSPGSILTSRTETSSLSRVVRDRWDPCSVRLSGWKNLLRWSHRLGRLTATTVQKITREQTTKKRYLIVYVSNSSIIHSNVYYWCAQIYYTCAKLLLCYSCVSCIKNNNIALSKTFSCRDFLVWVVFFLVIYYF